MSKIPQISFAAGEISPEIAARFDISKYHTGLELCKNFIVQPQGGARNRPGLEFIAPAKYHDKYARLVPFRFSSTQTYQLEFGNLYMRVFLNGGSVLDTAINIDDITQATTGVVTTSAAHGLTTGDAIFIKDVGGMTELNNRFFTVVVLTATTFTLKDGITEIAVNTTTLTAHTTGGTANPVYEVVTPYTESQLKELSLKQLGDVITITHPSHAPRDLIRNGHADWVLSTITFAPELAAPTAEAATNSTGSGSVTYSYKITSENDETGEESYPTAAASTTNDLSTAGNENTISWTAEAAADRYNVYKAKNGIYGYIGSATGTSFIDDNIAPSLSTTPPNQRNPFDAANNYPSANTYHQQRKVFAATNNKPQTVYSSQTGIFNNMSVSEPTKDTDAWTFAITTTEAIKYLLSFRDLFVFTPSEVWKITGSDGNTITPSSIKVESQSGDGISDVMPLIVGSTILYVAKHGRTVLDFNYKFETDRYSGKDLNILSKHFFKQYSITEWSYHKEPYRVVWSVREDGKLLGLTYEPDHDVYAWHQHNTDGKFISVSTIEEDAEDYTYFLIEREIEGKKVKYIERMHSRFFINIEDSFFVDSGLKKSNWNTNSSSTVTLSGGTNWTVDETLTLTENGTLSPFAASDVGRIIILKAVDSDGKRIDSERFEITAHTSSTVVSVKPLSIVEEGLQDTALTNYAFADLEVTNLWHLEGKDVSVLADGSVERHKVAGGKITLEEYAAQIIIGLQYNSDLKTVRIIGSPQNGTIYSHKKSISKVDLIVEESRGIFAGPDFDKLVEYKQSSDEGSGEPIRPASGIITIYLKPGWRGGQFVIRQSDPLPLNLLGIVPSIEVADD